MAKAWIFQDDKQVKKHGAKTASWYVGCIDPERKRRCQSCGPGSAEKNSAQKLQREATSRADRGHLQKQR
jgi:hypothetical protein